ncbi:unnamed protein product [Prorocentrum cordatum]|uniref:Uncharacterized protein n=1 Tax=Prorocentrum cordatum TaxID=2364126 RepID=A0ABN9PHT9_9DINO|nr:unnamed protein product [Polarella glacialis]
MPALSRRLTEHVRKERGTTEARGRRTHGEKHNRERNQRNPHDVAACGVPGKRPGNRGPPANLGNKRCPATASAMEDPPAHASRERPRWGCPIITPLFAEHRSTTLQEAAGVFCPHGRRLPRSPPGERRLRPWRGPPLDEQAPPRGRRRTRQGGAAEADGSKGEGQGTGGGGGGGDREREPRQNNAAAAGRVARPQQVAREELAEQTAWPAEGGRANSHPP